MEKTVRTFRIVRYNIVVVRCQGLSIKQGSSVYPIEDTYIQPEATPASTRLTMRKLRDLHEAID